MSLGLGGIRRCRWCRSRGRGRQRTCWRWWLGGRSTRWWRRSRCCGGWSGGRCCRCGWNCCRGCWDGRCCWSGGCCRRVTEMPESGVAFSELLVPVGRCSVVVLLLHEQPVVEVGLVSLHLLLEGELGGCGWCDGWGGGSWSSRGCCWGWCCCWSWGCTWGRGGSRWSGTGSRRGHVLLAVLLVLKWSVAGSSDMAVCYRQVSDCCVAVNGVLPQ